MSNRPQRADWILLLTLSVIWASSFAFIHVAVRSMPPEAMAAGRTGLAALILWGVMRWRGLTLPRIWPRPDPIWGWLMAIGLLGHALPFSLLGHSEREISSGLASILNAITPMFVAILAPMFVAGEHLSPRKIIGVAIGFAGVAVLVGWSALRQLGDGHVLAQALMVLVALSYAGNSIIARRLPRLDAVTASCGFNLCAAVLALPFAIAAPWDGMPTPAGLWAVLALAILPTAFGSVAYVWLIRRTSTLFVSTVNYLIPFWGVLIGGLFLGEVLPARAVVALVCILLGVTLVQAGRR